MQDQQELFLQTAIQRQNRSLPIYENIILLPERSCWQRAQEKQSLEEAIQRDIVTCYALEGVYPESLEYLKEHYGLTYNEDRYIVNYEALGSNLMPDVTVMEKQDTWG